ncbi:hypothetical protein NVP1007O_14 [Vibrio phage 1.007.O._10N.261.55.F9]|nr:hypothetical protein NVP1007O_14 [Vibrio phage 1.007.O._10N.261.55.F9]
MAIYFIRSETPTQKQKGPTEGPNINSIEGYNKMINDWASDVSKLTGWPVDSVEIISVNKLS